MAAEATYNLGTNPAADTIPESAIENNDSGALVSVINADTSTVTLANAKVHGLTKIGTAALSAYPLVIGTDTTKVPEAQVSTDNTGNLATVINADTSTVTLANAKVHGLTKIGTAVLSAYPLVVGTDTTKVPEAQVSTDNTGNLATVINADTSTVTLANAKVHGLTKIGTAVLSAYPLVVGTDTTKVPEAQVSTDNTGNLATVINADTSTVTLANAKVHGLTKIGTAVLSAYPLVVGTDVGASSPVALGAPALNPTSSPSSFAGTTAGTVYWSMPFQGAGYKRVVVYLSGYKNDTTTAQTLTYPTAFATAAVLTVNTASVPGVSTSLTALSLDPDTTSTYTGMIIVEGF